MHESELQQIGLTEKEAKVYLAALTLGKASAQKIAKKADLKRPTTYFTIDLLMEKGLMSSVHEGKKQFFMAENPDRLIDVFHKREDELKRQGEKLKDVIPDLKKLRPKGDGPVVKYYTGKEGAKAMVKNLHEHAEEQVWIAYPSDTVWSLFTEEEREEMRFTRNKKVLKVNAFYTSSTNVVESTDSIKRVRLKDKEALPADIAVYGDIVRLTSFEDEVVGVVVENKDIADSLRTLFKLAWESQK
jgi:sugar-specific transcriptional regulator TrmB